KEGYEHQENVQLRKDKHGRSRDQPRDRACQQVERVADRQSEQQHDCLGPDAAPCDQYFVRRRGPTVRCPAVNAEQLDARYRNLTSAQNGDMPELVDNEEREKSDRGYGGRKEVPEEEV